MILTALVGTTEVEGQTLRGLVVEEGRESPVAGAAVSLLSRDGNHRAGASADSLGRFLLSPPAAGEYYIESARIGYETTRSPLLALAMADTVPFEITTPFVTGGAPEPSSQVRGTFSAVETPANPVGTVV